MAKRIDLTKFTKRRDAISFFVVCGHVLLVITPVYIAAYVGPRISWIALWLWFGILMNGLLNLMHECAHYHTFRARNGSDFLGRWVLGPLAGTNFDAYRARHWEHHLHLGTDEDTKDAYLVDIRGSRLIWFCWRCLILSEAIRKFRHQTGKPSAKDEANSPIWMARTIVVQALFFVSLVLVAGPLHERQWRAAATAAVLAYVFVYGYGLASVTVFMSTLRAIAEHQVLDERAPVGHAALRNFTCGPLSQLAFGAYGFSEHGTHHREPSLPYYRLGEATRELAHENADLVPTESYVGELIAIFRHAPFTPSHETATVAERPS